MSRFRSPLPELALGVAALLLLAGALELALRVYHFVSDRRALAALPPVEERALVPSEDPELVFELNHGFDDGAFSVNSLGMAGPETTRAKPEGVFRIAFVGDSISANFGHRPRDEIYLNVLERRLAGSLEGGLEPESLNFGVNAYGILQLLRVAQTRVPAFDPDVVVVQLCLNDPYPSNTPYARIAPQGALALSSFLLRRLQPERFWASYYVEWLYDERGLGNVERGMRGLGEVARGGAPVLVVLFPYLYAPAYERWGFERYHEVYRSAAERAGLPFLDLRDAFADAGLLDNRWPMDPLHPGAEGHRVAGEEILRTLRSHALLPREP